MAVAQLAERSPPTAGVLGPNPAISYFSNFISLKKPVEREVALLNSLLGSHDVMNTEVAGSARGSGFDSCHILFLSIFS